MSDVSKLCCKSCRYNFTQTPKHGVPTALKSLALVLYELCGLSVNKIGKMFGVSNVAVLKWVRKEGEKVKDSVPYASSGIVMLDELWHFINEYRSGAPLMVSRIALSDDN